MGGRNGGRPPGIVASEPINYSEEVAAAICEGISAGETLKSVCSGEGMPTPPTVRRWVVNDREGFAARYNRAREVQADMMADQIITLADEAEGDANAIQKVRLQIEARKWLAGVMMPRKYANRTVTEVTGANGGPIVTKHQFPELKDMPDEDLLALREILLRRAAAEEDRNASAERDLGGNGPTRH